MGRATHSSVLSNRANPGAGHVAAVDKTEQRSNRPIGFGIVKFEGDILENPRFVDS